MNLSALRSNQGKFSMLELDSGYQLAADLGLDINVQGGLEKFRSVLRDLITHLASYPAAVVADPVFSFPLLLDDIEQGLILRLDQGVANIKPEATPQLASNWGVDEIANNYAVAKFELWYHPAQEAALNKKKMVAELYDYCQHVGIDLILKLNIHSRTDESQEKVVFQETQLQAVQEFRSRCHLMVLEYPRDALAAATLTAELDHAWIINLTAENHEKNKQHLRAALENGAEGFMIGNALFQEIKNIRQEDKSIDVSKIKDFIKTTARDRMIELVRITDEFKSN